MLKEPYHSRVLKLIEALESGKYEQCKNQLRYENSYCCLGVACDLCGDIWKLNDQGDWVYNDNFIYMSEDVVNYYGFKFNNGWFKEKCLQLESDSLTSLNDSGISFQEIAQVLREALNKDIGMFNETHYDS